nr:RND transporter hydrophobe/amphiphile efflux-1 (HAE1) family [Raoultella sp. NCTC 9187]
MAAAIPLVLAMTFTGMMLAGIGLQRISLGALIIALGLLVDDAMITVETMVSRLEAGDSRRQAATRAFKTTAFPMLTGTLVMIAGFIPVGFAASSAGEYCFFPVCRGAHSPAVFMGCRDPVFTINRDVAVA